MAFFLLGMKKDQGPKKPFNQKVLRKLLCNVLLSEKKLSFNFLCPLQQILLQGFQGVAVLAFEGQHSKSN
jgi:hypothetical protein